jgi:hypothetical protein
MEWFNMRPGGAIRGKGGILGGAMVQIKQLEDGTFISQNKYTHDILKKFGMEKANPSKLPWAQMAILILILVVSQLIKRYIAP